MPSIALPRFPARPQRRRRFATMPISACRAARSWCPALGLITHSASCVGSAVEITPLDIDCKDERVLADALSRHGKTPIIAQSGNGNFQAWYRYNGERRQIRPWPGLPIDILGGGFVVAPPSEGEKGRYQFIQGSLEDLDQLSVLRNLPQVSTPPIQTSAEPSEWREGDCRNNELFRRLMRLAHQVDNFEQLLDYAQTHNSQFAEPMADAEVVKVTSSVWGYQCTGRNRFGTFGSWSPLEEVTEFPGDPDAFYLLSYLCAHNSKDVTFWVANGLAETFGWTRKRLAVARRRLIELGYLRPIRQAGKGHVALYRWG